MKTELALLAALVLPVPLFSQNIREFSADTASFISELRIFTGTSLQTDELPDFERFVHLFDSLPFERQMEGIEVSNLMLNLKCRPRPHFIAFQRVIMEFFYEDKTFHGYEAWL